MKFYTEYKWGTITSYVPTSIDISHLPAEAVASDPSDGSTTQEPAVPDAANM